MENTAILGSERQRAQGKPMLANHARNGFSEREPFWEMDGLDTMGVSAEMVRRGGLKGFAKYLQLGFVDWLPLGDRRSTSVPSPRFLPWAFGFVIAQAALFALKMERESNP
jgi:hypothetical protein